MAPSSPNPFVVFAVPACETFRKRARLLRTFLLVAFVAVGPALAAGQPAGSERPQTPVEAQTPADGHGPAADEHGSADEEHGESPWATLARVLNFLILVGGLGYLLKGPIAQHLSNRRQQIGADLVAARETSDRASAQLADIDRRLKELPAEIETLKARGAAEVAEEEARIKQQAEAERHRLLEQTRREIAVQVRLARKALAADAADLSVRLAGERIARSLNPDDQARLVDRFVSQVKEFNG